MIRVLIADDHLLFRQSLSELLRKIPDIKIVGQAPDGDSCVRSAWRLNPDVILMDIDMPVMGGIDATRKILEKRVSGRCPQIIMLSMYSDKSHIFDSIRAGAMGYTVKGCSKEELAGIIRSVTSGSFTLHPSLSGNFVASIKTLPFEINPELTPKEIELMKCVSQGMSNKQIAVRLFMSERTVKNHLNLIFKKLAAANRAQAVNEAIRRGIITSYYQGTLPQST
jgi:DNA-binding NarL/FixJ family response regulator